SRSRRSSARPSWSSLTSSSEAYAARPASGARRTPTAARRALPRRAGEQGTSAKGSPSGEPRRVEQLELWLHVSRDRPRDQVAACEPEHVSVPRIAPGDPHPGPTRKLARERKAVRRLAPDSRPAVSHGG